MSRAVDENVDPMEPLIALFKASEFWGDYCLAAEISGDLVSPEVILRDRLMRQSAYQRLSFLCEDDRSRRLSIIELKFFEALPRLGRSRRMITKHRILAKHHPTTEHYSTPSELFENAGITVDRGEILLQPSRGPCVKLVELNPSALADATGLAGEGAAAMPIPKQPSDQKTIVEDYIAGQKRAGREATQRGCARDTGLKRSQVRKFWPPDVGLKRGRRY